MDGEVAIQPEGFEQPFVYRGFRMVDEEKIRNLLRGDELRKMNQNGMLPLIMAHLFSLSPRCATCSGASCSRARHRRWFSSSRRRRTRSVRGRILRRGRELAAEQRLAELDRRCHYDGPSGRSLRPARRGVHRDKGCRSTSNLQRVDSCRPGARGVRSTWPPANGSLKPGFEAAVAASDRAVLPLLSHAAGVFALRRSPMTISANAAPRRRHRVGSRAERAAEPVDQTRRESIPRWPGWIRPVAPAPTGSSKKTPRANGAAPQIADTGDVRSRG